MALPYGYVVNISQNGSVDPVVAGPQNQWQIKYSPTASFFDLPGETGTTLEITGQFRGGFVRLSQKFGEEATGITTLYSNELAVTSDPPPGGGGNIGDWDLTSGRTFSWMVGGETAIYFGKEISQVSKGTTYAWKTSDNVSFEEPHVPDDIYSGNLISSTMWPVGGPNNRFMITHYAGGITTMLTEPALVSESPENTDFLGGSYNSGMPFIPWHGGRWLRSYSRGGSPWSWHFHIVDPDTYGEPDSIVDTRLEDGDPLPDFLNRNMPSWFWIHPTQNYSLAATYTGHGGYTQTWWKIQGTEVADIIDPSNWTELAIARELPGADYNKPRGNVLRDFYWVESDQAWYALMRADTYDWQGLNYVSYDHGVTWELWQPYDNTGRFITKTYSAKSFKKMGGSYLILGDRERAVWTADYPNGPYKMVGLPSMTDPRHWASWGSFLAVGDEQRIVSATVT